MPSGASREDAPAPRASPPTSLLPPAIVTGVVTLLVGVPLWVQGFTFAPLRQAGTWILTFGASVVVVAAVRLVVAAVRGRLRGLEPRAILRHVASALAAIVLLGVVGSVYSWGKLLIPLFRGTTHDEALHAFEIAVHFGLDPGAVVQALLEATPGADTLIDWTYNQYVAILTFTIAWFFTQPDIDARHRFARGFCLLWLAGLAGYWLVPAHGPAFVFADLAPVLAERFPRSQALQAALIENYRNVLEAIADRPAPPVQIAFGIAAMPSLHVGVPAFATTWCWLERHPLRVAYLVVTGLMLVGCVATGWHYLVDGHAGLVLGAACALAVRRRRREPSGLDDETSSPERPAGPGPAQEASAPDVAEPAPSDAAAAEDPPDDEPTP